jgi:hypothetical protein
MNKPGITSFTGTSSTKGGDLRAPADGIARADVRTGHAKSGSHHSITTTKRCLFSIKLSNRERQNAFRHALSLFLAFFLKIFRISSHSWEKGFKKRVPFSEIKTAQKNIISAAYLHGKGEGS